MRNSRNVQLLGVALAQTRLIRQCAAVHLIPHCWLPRSPSGAENNREVKHSGSRQGSWSRNAAPALKPQKSRKTKNEWCVQTKYSVSRSHRNFSTNHVAYPNNPAYKTYNTIYLYSQVILPSGRVPTVHCIVKTVSRFQYPHTDL